MKIQILPCQIKVWLSARDTDDWRYKPGASWPCSTIDGRPLFAEFSAKNGDLVDLALNHGRGPQDIDCAELNAIVCDHLKDRLPPDHPAYWALVTRFL